MKDKKETALILLPPVITTQLITPLRSYRFLFLRRQVQNLGNNFWLALLENCILLSKWEREGKRERIALSRTWGGANCHTGNTFPSPKPCIWQRLTWNAPTQNLHTETSCTVSVLGGRYTTGFTTQVLAGYCHARSHKIVFTLGKYLQLY